jgi:hypothetical protein
MIFFSYQRNYKMTVKVARFYNIFGPEGSWNNGKEKRQLQFAEK